MYTYHYCIQINENTYDEKVSLDKLNDLSDKLNDLSDKLNDKSKDKLNDKLNDKSKDKLNDKSKDGIKVKEYWVNNILILSKNDILSYEYIEDISIDYSKKEKVLIQEYKKYPCNPFNFYKTDLEDEYILYEYNVKDCVIQIKKLKNHFTFQITSCEKIPLNTFDDFFLYL